MKHSQTGLVIGTGLAMFTMFFGAGNIVFPLALGQIAQDKNFYAILGMLITAVGVPFAGLISMSLFDGDYKQFFSRLGVIPGFIVSAAIMGLIGPFGAIPRCIALSYSTATAFLPDISISVFSLICCIAIFLLTVRPNTIMDMLGFVLTPILIGSLAIIVVMGLINAPEQVMTDQDHWSVFFKGIHDGYQTLDLLGAFFFSSVIVMGLKNDLPEGKATPKNRLTITLKATCIGALLLGMTYVGFSYIAAYHSSNLQGVTSESLITQIAIHVLGPYASIVAIVAVAFACLTTALALAAVFAEFIHKDVTFGKIGYIPSLIGTLVITFFVSKLSLDGIASFLVPILQMCYPALIVLTFLNIAYKLYDFKPVKIPVLIVFLISVTFQLLS
ncbi:MAG: branched-chain amino acid transport system II carrier protein [Parachlamydiaceae bacterium]